MNINLNILKKSNFRTTENNKYLIFFKLKTLTIPFKYLIHFKLLRFYIAFTNSLIFNNINQKRIYS